MASDHPSGPWCTECGSPGTATLPSMDPDRPLGRCSRGCRPGKGLGHLILTYAAAERLDAQRRWHRRWVTRQHHRHARGELTSPYCSECNRLGWSYAPAEPGTDAAVMSAAAAAPEGGP
jgi:hypothetical protein